MAAGAKAQLKDMLENAKTFAENIQDAKKRSRINQLDRMRTAFQAKKPLEIVELDLAGPTAGEVLVEIKATGRSFPGSKIGLMDLRCKIQ